ncbi:anti-anti-sigma regulatory factor [Pseudonocardia sediminis]|uniref:Anti-anti-sigma regulatory factor n=1 Tax=Pseudonocardia sediminis TaxID=1397368 RepID=A0A4Q7UZW8_PSEST|nr:STAS domain-containing protein [Pseudonocardia sediminis]RZT86694.1 anti-anti-sigma regulatory factor [Pseudonocardia sediminis]
MSVHICDRCGDVTVDAERCHCMIAAAAPAPAAALRRPPAGVAPVRPGPRLQPAPHSDAAPPRPVPARRRTLAVRLHTPLPRVTVAQISGTLEESTAAVLSEKVTALFGRAVHIVVDLTGTATLTHGGVRVLLGLHREATGRGTQLHLTRPSASAGGTGRKLLDRLATDRLIRLAPSADAVLSALSGGPSRTSATS